MKLESFTINKSFSHVISFTAVENKIYLRTMKIIYDDVRILFRLPYLNLSRLVLLWTWLSVAPNSRMKKLINKPASNPKFTKRKGTRIPILINWARRKAVSMWIVKISK